MNERVLARRLAVNYIVARIGNSKNARSFDIGIFRNILTNKAVAIAIYLLLKTQTASVVQLFHWSKIAKADFIQPISKLNYNSVQQQKIFQN